MKNKTPNTVVSDCTFTGVEWDKSTLETIDKVAQGLLNLTDLFKSQNVQIDTLLLIKSLKDADTNE